MDKKIIFQRNSDGKNIEGRLVEVFEHTNEPLGTKQIALIFYPELIYYKINGEIITNEQLVFRYIEYPNSSLEIHEECSKYPGNTKYDILKLNSSSEFYIEDKIYNFVNYDGIKY